MNRATLPRPLILNLLFACSLFYGGTLWAVEQNSPSPAPTLTDTCGLTGYHDGTYFGSDGKIVPFTIKRNQESAHCRELLGRPALNGECVIADKSKTHPCSSTSIRAKAVDGLTSVEFKTDVKGHFSINLSPIRSYRLEVMDPAFRVESETVVSQGDRVSIRLISNADQPKNIKDQKAYLAALPTRKPVPGLFVSGFGITKNAKPQKMHKGLDILATAGQDVRAPSAGTIVYIGPDRNRADDPEMANVIIIDHGFDLQTCYGSLGKITAKKGDHLQRGDVLGHAGSLAVHYEVRVHGVPVDPLPYILDN